MSLFQRGAVSCALLMFTALAACDTHPDEEIMRLPSGLEVRSSVCDFQGAAKNARDFFPGNGNEPPLSDILENLKSMESACDAGYSETYTDLWYDNASIIQTLLGNGGGDDEVAGDAFLDQTTAMLGPDGLIFDPCEGGPTATCLPWEGYPDELPDWFEVLTDERGMWAVLPAPGDLQPGVPPNAVQCSGFVYPCAVDSRVSPVGGDHVGVEPSPDWATVFGGLTTLQIGHVLKDGEEIPPTGEQAAASDIQAYRLLLIPERTPFVAGELRVGLCSLVTPQIDELTVQKGQNGTILNEVSIATWCDTDATPEPNPQPNLFQRLGAFLSPAPARLEASAFLAAGPGMGGRAGGYTDFYFVDIVETAVQELLNQPVTGTAGKRILDANGQPLQISTYTMSGPSPVENVEIVATVIGNNGLVPSGNVVSADNLVCPENEMHCKGFTDADEEPNPGTLTIENLVITKPGQYSICFKATLRPLVFNNPVCTDKFIMNP